MAMQAPASRTITVCGIEDVLVRFDNKTRLQDAQRVIAAQVAEALPKSRSGGSRWSVRG
ncbi:MAG TPA: hypothetical protein VHT21_22700 [Stellaceae bacterium]|nr:hypothetical protein [Stellaceae bacterium]